MRGIYTFLFLTYLIDTLFHPTSPRTILWMHRLTGLLGVYQWVCAYLWHTYPDIVNLLVDLAVLLLRIRLTYHYWDNLPFLMQFEGLCSCACEFVWPDPQDEQLVQVNFMGGPGLEAMRA